ncbi:hypothetical protein [Martelella alba]|uniref:Uncharacterized protein n=1 Tax=Martelella alba TaxID=2590451 RepID=A0ABY2SQR8_9HYPH|nr:hypothetical protein [Martelella alba]TKI08081.1 hypothetical protein FCN80_02715 [Martelella alba]
MYSLSKITPAFCHEASRPGSAETRTVFVHRGILPIAKMHNEPVCGLSVGSAQNRLAVPARPTGMAYHADGQAPLANASGPSARRHADARFKPYTLCGRLAAPATCHAGDTGENADADLFALARREAAGLVNCRFIAGKYGITDPAKMLALHQASLQTGAIGKVLAEGGNCRDIIQSHGIDNPAMQRLMQAFMMTFHCLPAIAKGVSATEVIIKHGIYHKQEQRRLYIVAKAYRAAKAARGGLVPPKVPKVIDLLNLGFHPVQ